MYPHEMRQTSGSSLNHEECDLSFNEICHKPPFKHTTLHPRMLERNYNLVKEHGGDYYWDGQKGNSGRKKQIHSKNMLFMFTSHFHDLY
jgi:hypothetical protein